MSERPDIEALKRRVQQAQDPPRLWALTNVEQAVISLCNYALSLETQLAHANDEIRRLECDAWEEADWKVQAAQQKRLARKHAFEDACKEVCNRCADDWEIWFTHVTGYYHRYPKGQELTGNYCRASAIRALMAAEEAEG